MPVEPRHFEPPVPPVASPREATTTAWKPPVPAISCATTGSGHRSHCFDPWSCGLPDQPDVGRVSSFIRRKVERERFTQASVVRELDPDAEVLCLCSYPERLSSVPGTERI